jgi:hypothetical protein
MGWGCLAFLDTTIDLLVCSTRRFGLWRRAWRYVAERISSGSEYASGKGVGVCERDYAELYIAAGIFF